MPLTYLNVATSPVESLKPLSGINTLKVLSVGDSKVNDLTPLAGLKVESLWLNKLNLPDLTPLRGLPLKELYLFDSDVADLTPLSGSPIENAVGVRWSVCARVFGTRSAFGARRSAPNVPAKSADRTIADPDRG